jgi:sulfonate transport system permease protein
MKKIGIIFEYLILLIIILGVWFIMDYQGKLNSVILPSPERVWCSLVSVIKDGTLWENVCISIVRVLKGYLLAITFGIILGIFIGLSKHVQRITDLVVQILKPIPPIAWIPIVILWFGIGEEGKTFLIFLGGFFTVLINVIDGIHQIDPKLIEASKAAEVPFHKFVILGIIPGAAPGIFTGLRLGISSCWMCVVAAELISASSGLGFMIMNARQFGQTDYVIIGMLTIGIIGKLMDSLLKLLERRVIKWI